MDKHDIRLAPFSSDEYGQSNSAEDSDEDVITDYLSGTGSAASSGGVLRGAPARDMALRGGLGLAGALAGALAAGAGAGGSPGSGATGSHVPIISVTPHSPGGKQYPVLEDNLQQLHEIHESIQQMRELSLQHLNSQLTRSRSSSCPSLVVDPGSDPDLLSSVNSSPIQVGNSKFSGCAYNDLLYRNGSSKDWVWRGAGLEPDGCRRRSWTALEDLANGKGKRKSGRQRSMSLSSMDSEGDDPFMDTGGSGSGLLATDAAPNSASANATAPSASGSASASGPGGRRGNRANGGASTHSLNEADLQSDFQKIQAKREAEARLMPTRLPLQKSVSTPSIVAVRDIAGADAQLDGTTATIQPFVSDRLGNNRRPVGTESETEEDLITSFLEPELVPTTSQLSLRHLLADTEYDHHAEKRRKRGSLFFRKKKDKVKKFPHQWVSVSSVHSCDWCSKSLTNKPAVYCENCATTVHQTSCKDHVQDCKAKSGKNVSKSSASSIMPTSNSKPPSDKKKTSISGMSLSSNSSNSQIINEEKEANGGHFHDPIMFSDEAPLVQFEFLDESPVTASDLETDPAHGLQAEEPDSWTPTVSKEVTKKLKEKEIKRQEHMYEFILTEKHHCLTLRVMQKVFVEGLQKHFQLGARDLERMFPRLDDLTEIHLEFLAKLRERQRASPVIDTLSDVLLDQFSGDCAARLKACYGEFCSRHRDAVNMYKCHLHDRRFGEFVKHCQANPLLKKKGIPECILFVTQRLTKYPLLIEPLIKTSKDNKMEQEKLSRALALVKEILVEVDAQVAEKEKEDRKLEIYNRIDAKSSTFHRQRKFKKSDILAVNRKLRFEGLATLMQHGRKNMQVVMVIVLSDVLFFLTENNSKYHFCFPDNRAGVISLQKLLVREKAGQESRGIYLISSNPSDPEMFELKVHKPKDKQTWIQAIRAAVQACPEDEEDGVHLSQEEKQQQLDAKQAQIRQIVGILRQKDVEAALIMEEKMALQQQLAGIATSETPSYCHLVTEDADSSRMWQEVVCTLREVNQLASTLYASGTNLSRSVSSVGEHQSSAYVSPTLPKRAETFGGFDNANKDPGQSVTGKVVKKPQQAQPQVPTQGHSRESSISSSPALTSAANHPVDPVPWKNAMMATVNPGMLVAAATGGGDSVSASSSASTRFAPPAMGEMPALMTLGQEQQAVALQLSHHVYRLSCIITQQMTSIEGLQAQLAAYRSQLTSDSENRERKPAYRQTQQLEELRNLQDKLTQEKEAWAREKEDQERELTERRDQLQRLQEQVRADQTDVTQQREQLYRKLEMLTNQGILISPNMPVAGPAGALAAAEGNDGHAHALEAAEATGPVAGGVGAGAVSVSPTPTSQSAPSPPVRKVESSKWKSAPNKPAAVPLNLISAANQQKAAQSVQIKQQLPLKLSSKLGALSSSSASGSPSSSPSSSGGGIQQMLPLKLSQGGSETRRSGGGTGGGSVSGYERLASGSGSVSPPPPPPRPHSGLAASHVRTGSSPAMMQNVFSPDGSPTSPSASFSSASPSATGTPLSSGNRAGRTNTYPKIPDRYRVRSPDTNTSPRTPTNTPNPPEEEVIFF